MTVPFIRKSTRRNSSWPGDSALHSKAEYICADLSIDPSLFPCSPAADHTFSGNLITIQRMNSSVLNPTKIAVLYYFGDLDYWKLPDIAAEALVAGFDGVVLRKLAGLTNVVASDLIPADVDAAFREMGIDAPISKDVARLALAAESAKKALGGQSNVFDEATHIRIHLCGLKDSPPELQRIVDLARQARGAPRITWKALEGEPRAAMSRFLESQPHAIDPAR
jgi:hypothetical protein